MANQRGFEKNQRIYCAINLNICNICIFGNASVISVLG